MLKGRTAKQFHRGTSVRKESVHTLAGYGHIWMKQDAASPLKCWVRFGFVAFALCDFVQ